MHLKYLLIAVFLLSAVSFARAETNKEAEHSTITETASPITKPIDQQVIISGANPSVCEVVPELLTTEVPGTLTLNQAEELFLNNNLAVIAARYGVDVSTGLKIIASYTPNPQLTLSAEQFNLRHPFMHPFEDRGSVDENFYTGRVDQIFEAPGRKKYRTQAAIWQVQVSEAQVLDAIRTNLFQLKQIFYTAVLARNNLLVAEENIRTISETEEKLQKNVKGGNIAEADLTRFQVGKIQFESDRVTAKLTYVQSIRSLLNLIGAKSGAKGAKSLIAPVAANESAPAPTPAGDASAKQPLPDADVEVIGVLRKETVEPDLLELQRETENRSDVLAARRAVDAALASLHYTRVGRYPDLTLGMEYQRNGPGNTVGLALQLPLPILHNQQGEMKQGEGQLAQAETSLKQARLQALTDVDNGYKAYETNLALLNIYTSETIDKAKEAYRIARVLYDQGAGSRLDVLDAQRTYNAIRVASNQAHFNLLVAIFQLEQATGRKLIKE